MRNLINFNEFVKGIIVICLYFVLPSIIISPFLFFLKSLVGLPVFYIYVHSVLAIFFVILYRKDIIKDFEDMKKNYKTNIKIALKYWLKGLFIMYVSSFIINIFGITENINQQNNINYLQAMPITEFVLACLFAPLIEELVFRRALSKAFNSDFLYVCVTGFIFGFIHILASLLGDISTIIYLIPYCALGISFAYIYKKTNNIFSSMIVHSIHNFIALLSLIILGGLL